MFPALIGCSILFTLVVLYVAHREGLALYHPLFLFCLWHLLFYILVPWHIWLKGDWSTLVRYGVPLHNDYYLVKTLLLVHLGLLATLAGWYSGLGRRWAARVRLPRIVIHPGVALGVILIFLLIGAYSMFTYHGIPGISHSLINPMSKDEFGRTIMTGGTGYAFSGYLFLAGAGLLAAFLCRRQGWAWLFFTCCFISGYVGFAMLRGWSRAGWVLFLLGLASLWLMQRGRRWPPLWWFPAALPLFILFNISAVDRDAWKKVIEEGTSLQTYVERANERITEERAKADIGNYQLNTFQVMLYPERVPYEWGRGYFNSWLVAPLPRYFFKDKDKYMLPTNLSRTTDIYHTVGPTTGLYIDFYRNFGIPGIFLGCFLFGLTLHIVWQTLIRHLGKGREWQYTVLIYAGLVAFLPQLMRDGLTSLFKGYLFILTPILLAIIFSMHKRNFVLKTKYSYIK